MGDRRFEEQVKAALNVMRLLFQDFTSAHDMPDLVLLMTIGDHPALLAVGYLLNQGMLPPRDEITAIDFEPDIETIVVRTRQQTNVEDKLKKKIQTSGCAQGTVFGDLMDALDGVRLAPDARVRTSWLYQLTRKINTQPSLYLKTGAIHGCALCVGDRPLLYMEDVGRHNAGPGAHRLERPLGVVGGLPGGEEDRARPGLPVRPALRPVHRMRGDLSGRQVDGNVGRSVAHRPG